MITTPANITESRKAAPTSVRRIDSYEDEDYNYIKYLLSDISTAQQQRDTKHMEFGNKTYLQRYYDNIKKASTILPEKKYKSDVIISAGTLESKLDAVLSAVNNLNLSVQIRPFDRNNNFVAVAGVIMEDSMFQANELDNDEEKKHLRQKEMLVQGEVFVEEKWSKRYKYNKTLNMSTYKGQFKDVEWTKKLEKVFEGPERTIKYGPNIYLGDITQYNIEDQPFIFEVMVESRQKVESIFGTWENWKYVKEQGNGLVSVSGTENSVDKRWTLRSINTDQCEVIFYQNRFKNEYAIIIDGILMTPRGFPLSAVSPNGEYTIQKQVFKNVHAHFAYGKSFIETAEKAAAILDEMLKLAVLKTRNSFMPPYINTSKKLISSRVLQAGKITQGIAPGTLQPINDNAQQGVAPSEFQLIQRMQDTIDQMTVSPIFAGQQGKSGTTATEVLEVKRQAEMTMGLIVLAAGLLEKKIGYLRLWNMLENWFRPIEKTVISEKAVNRFRRVSRETTIPGEGTGEREVIPTDGNLPTPEEIRILEKEEEHSKGFPIQKIFFNPDQMRNAVRYWYITVSPAEKDSSEFAKIMFREELNDILTMTQFGSTPNVDAIEEKFARVYKHDKNKVFAKANRLAAQDIMMQNPSQVSGTDVNQGVQKQPQPKPNMKGQQNAAGVPTLNNVG